MFLYSSDSTLISWQRWCMSNVVTAIHSLSRNTEDVFQSSRPTLHCGVENNRNNQMNKSRPFWHEHARILLMLICLCPNGTSLSVSTAWMVDVSTKPSTTNTNVALMSSFRPKLMWRLGWWSRHLGKTLFSLHISYFSDTLGIAWSKFPPLSPPATGPPLMSEAHCLHPALLPLCKNLSFGSGGLTSPERHHSRTAPPLVPGWVNVASICKVKKSSGLGSAPTVEENRDRSRSRWMINPLWFWAADLASTVTSRVRWDWTCLAWLR